MGQPAQNDKTRNLKFSNLRIIGALKSYFNKSNKFLTP